VTVTFNISNDEVRLVGNLTRDNVASISAKQVKEIIKKDVLKVNLSGIDKVDTSGLAWLFLLLEKAKKQSCQLVLIEMPEDMIKLANLSRVESLLPTV